MRLAGKVALVTGAGGPMGKAIARQLAAEGADLVLTDISQRRLAAAADELGAALAPGRALAQLRADATQRAEAASVVALAHERFGRVDVLVNVVGGIKAPRLLTPFLELSEAQWDSTFALNLKPGFNFAQLVVPGMLERAYGKIVNVASAVFGGEAGQVDYAAAKAAVASMTRSLSLELAPHVNVNCVAPGLIRTTVVERLDPDEQRHFTAQSAMKRLGEAREVAATVCFLASDEASFLTGEIVAVAGGYHPAL